MIYIISYYDNPTTTASFNLMSAKSLELPSHSYLFSMHWVLLIALSFIDRILQSFTWQWHECYEAFYLILLIICLVSCPSLLPFRCLVIINCLQNTKLPVHQSRTSQHYRSYPDSCTRYTNIQCMGEGSNNIWQILDFCLLNFNHNRGNRRCLTLRFRMMKPPHKNSSDPATQLREGDVKHVPDLDNVRN